LCAFTISRAETLFVYLLDFRHKAVTALWHGLDKLVSIAVIPQNLTQDRDVLGERGFFDEGVGPEQPEKSFLFH
jgi:hypothetical protein